MSQILPRIRRHWVEYATTIVLLAVSVLSLWVAIGTEDANRAMVAASSWPFLQIDSSNGDDEGHDKIMLSLVNAGVGPAKVETFEVFWHGKAYATSFALFRACCAVPGVAPRKWSLSVGNVSDVVIRAGESRRFLTFVPTPDNAEIWKTFDKVRYSQLSFRTCYCSVFDECWVSDLKSLKPTPVKVCPVPKVSYSE